MTTKHQVINNTDKRQYEMPVDGYTPLIEYMVANNGGVYLTHTEVPIALEGMGIGTEMVRQALEDIKDQGLKVVPMCPFVASYIRKNPEWRSLVLEGFNA